MEFTEVVRRRRMVRNYSSEPVPPDVLDRVLAHALRAPSAGFAQGWAFLVLDTPADVARYWAATAGDRLASPDSWLRGMMTAPVIIVPLSCEAAYRARYTEPDKRRGASAEQGWPVPYWHLDAAMASLLMLLTAVDEGLGACFFGLPAHRTEAFRAEFGVPGDHMPIGAITLGHRVPDAGSKGSGGRPRRGLTDVVHRGGWTVRDAPAGPR